MTRHSLTMRALVVCVLLAACSEYQPTSVDKPVVALIGTPTQDLDVLVVMDDSIDLDAESAFKNAFPAFLDELGTLPNLHVGVVTSDLGTKGFDDAAPGPSIGSGPGSCSGEGKGGHLVTSGSQMVQGTFISDIATADGSRTTNYTGSLAGAFSSIASVGAGGCGFEQPLEAMRKQLVEADAADAGFLRTDARLAVIALQDEDDCSFAHSTLVSTDTATVGPLQSFRCTRFGVTCAAGGLTTDAMNIVGMKDGCRSRDDSPYMPSIARYRDVLRTVKPDARDVLFAVIAGPPEPVVVELRTAPGGGTAIPALRHSCGYQGANGTNVADPAVRMHELTTSVPRGMFESVCALDQTPAVRAIARQVRTLLGDTCVPVYVAQPETCEAYEVRVDGTRTAVAFELVSDVACSASGLRVIAHPSTTPSADSNLMLRCAQ